MCSDSLFSRDIRNFDNFVNENFGLHGCAKAHLWKRKSSTLAKDATRLPFTPNNNKPYD